MPATHAKRSLAGWLYTLPAAVVYLPLVLVPLGYSLWLSLHRWNGLSPDWQWRGLANYSAALSDEVFWLALGHNLALLAGTLLIQLPLAMLLAVLLSRAGRLTGVLRGGLFLPYVLPTVIIAIVWQLLLNEVEPQLLGSTRWSLLTLIGVISWRFVGFHMVLYLAGISGIDPRLYEAAELDGAGPWQQFRHITLPELRPVLVVSVTLAVVGCMKYFDIIWVMTEGGPARSSELLATYMYKQGFQAFRMGYASALAVLLALLAFVGLAIAWTLRRVWGRN